MARTDPKVFTPILPRDGGIRLSDAEILGHAAISAGDLHSYISRLLRWAEAGMSAAVSDMLGEYGVQ